MKKITWGFIDWLVVNLIFGIPALLILLGFDFFFDFDVNMFDNKASGSRIILFIWFLFYNIAFVKVEYWESLKKLANEK